MRQYSSSYIFNEQTPSGQPLLLGSLKKRKLGDLALPSTFLTGLGWVSPGWDPESRNLGGFASSPPSTTASLCPLRSAFLPLPAAPKRPKASTPATPGSTHGLSSSLSRVLIKGVQGLGPVLNPRSQLPAGWVTRLIRAGSAKWNSKQSRGSSRVAWDWGLSYLLGHRDKEE